MRNPPLIVSRPPYSLSNIDFSYIAYPHPLASQAIVIFILPPWINAVLYCCFQFSLIIPLLCYFQPAKTHLPSRNIQPSSQCDCSCTSESACRPSEGKTIMSQQHI